MQHSIDKISEDFARLTLPEPSPEISPPPDAQPDPKPRLDTRAASL